MLSAPVSKPIAVVTTLNVEPGMYRSAYAFANNGLRSSSCSAVNVSFTPSPLFTAIRLGLNDGLEYMATTAPVTGSITTTDPSRLPNASRAAF